MDVQIYGIRHHGPGSARNLINALQAFDPQAVLIEGPPDANSLLAYASAEGMEPPIALMVYDPLDFSQASYFPFAGFSPEWQAIQFAMGKEISVSFIDLPVGLQEKWEGRPSNRLALNIEENENEDDRFVRLDPLGYLAKLSGRADGEQWWEETFEQWERVDGVFGVILELMRALREEVPEKRKETLLREAHMRKCIRKAIKDGHERIAVVCGAWHAPALAAWNEIPAKADNALLKGVKKKKTQAAWIPWSYSQLSRLNGYGAGVISPAWYDLLFESRSEVAIRWMTQAARLLRDEGNDVSSAHVIEAARLAETLAAMRQRPAPGLDELRESALSVLCEGDTKWLDLIEKRLIIGERTGTIGPEVPVVPLQKDIDMRIRKARLTRYWGGGRSNWVSKELDLRKDNQLKTSYLIHSMGLLGISYGVKIKTKRKVLGTFHEFWWLSWSPDIPLQIAEASVYGSTIEEAGTNRVIKLAREATKLNQLTDLTDVALKANLIEPISYLIKRLEEVAASTTDVWLLMQSIPALLKSVQHGSARKSDVSSIEQVLDHLLPRIFVGLPNAGASLDEAKSKEFFALVSETSHHLQASNRRVDHDTWIKTLLATKAHRNVHPFVKGGLCRLLFDKSCITTAQTSREFAYALSTGQDPEASAFWLEGFLQQSGLLLLHHPPLWAILDQWVAALPAEQFESMLVILRRAFSQIPRKERNSLLAHARKSLDTVFQEAPASPPVPPVIPPQLVQTLQQLLSTSLG